MKLFKSLTAFASVAGAANIRRHSTLKATSTSNPYLSDNRTPIYIYHAEWPSIPMTGAQFSEDLVRMFNSGIFAVHLAFYLINVPAFPNKLADSVERWTRLTPAEKSAALTAAKANSGHLSISTGGQSAYDYWLEVPPVDYAKDVCGFAKGEGMDMVDFNMESIYGGYGSTSRVYDWLYAAITECKNHVQLVSTAPEAPLWAVQFPGGQWDMVKLAKAIPDLIFQTQYYNQGNYNGLDYNSAFLNGAWDGQAAVMQVVKRSGMESWRHVWGKPFASNHVEVPTNNWWPTATLREWYCKANREQNYNGGLMFWKYDYANKEQFFTNIATLVAPCDGSAFTPGTSTPAPAVVTTPRPPVVTTTRPPAVTTTVTTRAPAVPAVTTESVSDCQMRITSSNDKWARACQAQCAFYANAGKCNCGSMKTSDCIANHHDWCWISSTGGGSGSASDGHGGTTGGASSDTSGSSAGVVDGHGGTTGGASSGTGGASCASMVKGTQAHWDAVCQERCSLYAPGGALVAWCPSNKSEGAIANCVVSQSPGVCALK